MLLSIIIPAYNEQTHLSKCVCSVLSGIGNDSEILIVDDGSTDDTASVAQQLILKHPSVKLLRHPDRRNRGVAASRNLGLEKAKGKYIAFIDADDVCLPTRFAGPIEILNKQHDFDGVLVAVAVVFEDGADVSAKKFLPAMLDHDPNVSPDGFAIATLEGKSKFHISNIVFRKSLLAKSGIFNSRRKLGEEDTDFWLRMALCGKFCVLNGNEPQVFYRRHIGNNWNPNPADSFRDLMVLSKVLTWSKKSPWVSKLNVNKLEDVFSEKVICCLLRARYERMFSRIISISWQTAVASPRLFLRSRYWRNVLRVIWN